MLGSTQKALREMRFNLLSLECICQMQAVPAVRKITSTTLLLGKTMHETSNITNERNSANADI